MMNWYSKDKREVIAHFKTDAQNGLDAVEAQKRLIAGGSNALQAKKGKSLLKKIIEQLSDFMIIVLLCAAALSFVISALDGDADFADPIIILAIVVLNAAIGIAQESKAERAIESLQKLSAPKTAVMRSGEQISVDSQDLVKGDIVLFETGDSITADARILESTGLRVQESSLTGESIPASKAAEAKVADGAPLGERKNMVYSGCSIAAGRCRAVVTATGMDTEVGKIAALIDTAEIPETPLQKRLAETGKALGMICMVICALVFLLGVIQKTNILDSFMLAVSLAVAAIPEGLPAIVTIVLALGVQRMAGKNAIVRKLPAVETLGSATVICADKTGTLTQNKMTVQTLTSAAPLSAELKTKLLTYGALCTNCRIVKEGGKRLAAGDPTENAIVNAALEQGIDKAGSEYPRVSELPFDSDRKLMTTVHHMPGGKYLTVTKGAPDMLIRLCDRCDTGSVTQMSDGFRQAIVRENTRLGENALRILGIAYNITDRPPSSADAEKNLIFLGLVGMMDKPRPEVRLAVDTCRHAGVKPVMITGDHAVTAAAIARELDILKPGGRVITGAQIDKMDQQALRSAVNDCTVFARVTPEHKSRVVRAFQENGEIVAMTGDGVNDAPALKSADIGCAMGKSGTDVARDASDLILTDDNFATIVSAVREGRGIYQNICKSVHFLLSCNIGEILTVLVSFLLGMPTPLIPIQLLWVNLVTDSLPALAIGAEKADTDIMDRMPVNPKSSMFSGGRGGEIIIQGLVIGAVALLAFSIGLRSGGLDTGRTFAFAVLSISQLVHSFNVRSSESLFKIGFLSNPQLTGAFVICCLLQVSVICIPPLAGVFGVVPLTFAQWRTVALLSLIPLLAVEAGKLFSSIFSSESNKELSKG